MKNSRRSFIKTLGALGVGASFAPVMAARLEEQIRNTLHASPEAASDDESFWAWVQESYTVNPNIINLNNGGVSPQPRIVQEAMIRFYEMANEIPSLYMWGTMDEGREPVRRELAQLAGCLPDEIAINRNATEALETVIFGLPLKAGDEVVLTKQDYPNMINAWKQREKRDGVVLNWINLNLPNENEDEIVAAFEKAITPRTKLVHVTHLINWMGQILPAKRIIEAAHRRGTEVLLDGAHTFAHFDFSLHDLNCEYFGTSLHKWLGAPFGSGFLYVRKDKIPGLWPLFGTNDPTSGDIRKYESLGTRSFPIEQAIGAAVRFHDSIGILRKQERLRYLTRYWAQRAAEIPGVKVHTPLKPGLSGAVALVSVEGKKPAEIKDFLHKEYKIHAVGIEWENISGVRITPNVYTGLRELDILVDALRAAAKA